MSILTVERLYEIKDAPDHSDLLIQEMIIQEINRKLIMHVCLFNNNKLIMSREYGCLAKLDSKQLYIIIRKYTNAGYQVSVSKEIVKFEW